MLECKGGREISHLKNCSMVFVASEGEALKVRGGSGKEKETASPSTPSLPVKQRHIFSQQKTLVL